MTQAKREQLSEALRWALELTSDPAMAAADWLARDIDVARSTAVELLSEAMVSLDKLKKAKNAFKTMRIVGEHAADRRLGGRLYLAAIASGIVHHDTRISTQSDGALLKALREFIRDESMPEPLRQIADLAYLSIQNEVRVRSNDVLDEPGA
jgi:hypothetical protein